MKNLFMLLAVVLMFSGCSYKNESLVLSKYDEQYLGELSKDKKRVFIEFISDIRDNKKNIGYVLEGDKKAYNFHSAEDFTKNYEDALKIALKMAGFENVANRDDADLIMNIDIKKIEFVYNNKLLDKNLKGNIELEVRIKRGASTITQNFKQAASKWIKLSYSSKDIEPFLSEIFSQSVNSIVSRLTRY